MPVDDTSADSIEALIMKCIEDISRDGRITPINVGHCLPRDIIIGYR